MFDVSSELRWLLDEVEQISDKLTEDGDAREELKRLASRLRTVQQRVTEELWKEFESYTLALKEEAEDLARRQKLVRLLCRHNSDPDDESCYFCGQFSSSID